MIYTIATAATSKAAKWTNEQLTWAGLRGRLRTPVRTRETMAEYAVLSKEAKNAIKDVGGFVGGATSTGRRKQGHIPARGLLTLDADNAGDIDGLAEALARVTDDGDWVIYSTHSHTPERPRVRVVIPLSREADSAEYEAIGRRITQETGIERYDVTTYQMERLMYWPSVCADGEYIYRAPDLTLRGPLDVDTVLASYKDFRDQSQWPRHARELENPARRTGVAGLLQEDPTEKVGIIGAFCRAYTLEEAMETFLPGVYEPAGKDRYTYTGGTSHGGAVVYDGKWIYSNHQSDPASLQLCNAFDLVRLHRFGCLDEGHQTTRKSMAAMEALASSDSRTSDQRIKEAFDAVPAAISTEKTENGTEKGENSTEWLKPYLTPKGNLRPDPTLFRDILIYDRELSGLFARDGFEDREIFRKAPPWRSLAEGQSVTDQDMACLRTYIFGRYKVEGRQKIDDAVQAVEAMIPYHSLREHLDRLPEWDGRERAERALVTYLGADDTALTRAMTRRMLLAAVMRAFRPGTKFDQMMVLVGPQGCGKSTFIRNLAMRERWFSDSLPSPDREKEAMEHLRGKWILEVGEMASMNKADVAAVKMFLSKTQDSFRPPYGRMTVDRPRQCVFFATTNEAEFLRDDTGERRYWPVECHKNTPELSVWDDMPHDVPKIWAEVLTWAKGAEDGALVLPRSLSGDLQTAQAAHKRGDTWDGLIEEWLDITLPADWYTDRDRWTVESRHAFMTGRRWAAMNADHEEFPLRRDSVSIAEIVNECGPIGLTGNVTQIDRVRIGAVMGRMPGWEKIGIRQCGVYGKQMTWRKLETVQDRRAKMAASAGKGL